MKVAGAMKKRVKRVSKIAKGKYAKALIFKGAKGKVKTASGLRKEDLMKNKRGKVVSKRSAMHGRSAYKYICKWTAAVVAARKALAMTGFVAINGKNREGKALYAKAKSLYNA